MYWLVYQSTEGVSVVLQPSDDLTHARFAVDLAKLNPGAFSEGHKLNAKMVKHIPEDLIGKRLSARQAQQLLNKLSKG